MKTLPLMLVLLLPLPNLHAQTEEMAKHCISQIRAKEEKNNVKCLSSFRRQETALAGAQLQLGSTHGKAHILQKLAEAIWSWAENTDPRSQGKLTRTDVDNAVDALAYIHFKKMPGSGEIVCKTGVENFQKVVFQESTLKDYGNTSDTWRVLLAAIQNPEKGFRRDLNEEAAARLIEWLDISGLLLLRLAKINANEAGSHTIREKDMQQAGNALFPFIHKPVFSNTNLLGKQAKILPLAIWNAETKISDLRHINGEIDETMLLRHESELAGRLLESSASRYFRDVLLRRLAKDVWLKAQANLPQGVKLITGDVLARSLDTDFPHALDTDGRTFIFFPESDPPLRYLEYEMDSFRDNGIHWIVLLNMLKSETRPYNAAPSQGDLIPLDPYAAEELTEFLSNIAVPILKKAGEFAEAQNAPHIKKEHLTEALAYFTQYLKKHPARHEKAHPVESARTPAEKTSAPLFADITKSSRLDYPAALFNDKKESIMQKYVRGVAVEDYDRDGLPDVLLVDADAPPRLFRNTSAGRFEDVTAKSGLPSHSQNDVGASFADYDNDGWPDLLITSFEARSRLFKNLGNGRFRETTDKAGLSKKAMPSMTGLWLDYDNDGHLDLYVLNYGSFMSGTSPTIGNARNGEPNVLYHNNGDGTFSDTTKATGAGDTGWGFAAGLADYDKDGDTDIYIANDFGQNTFYKNRGDGTFEDTTDASGLSNNGAGMGVSVADVDRDGWPDIYLTNIGMFNSRTRFIRPDKKTAVATDQVKTQYVRIINANRLFRNKGDGTFEDKTETFMEPAATGWGWGGVFFDFDNDGDQDLYMPNGFRPDYPFYNNENNLLFDYDAKVRRFRPVGKGNGADFPGNSRVGAYTDIDGDGLLDLIVVGMDKPVVLKGLGQKEKQHWLKINLKGKHSNRDGIGARVTLKTGKETQYAELGNQGGGFLGSLPRSLHFGLGPYSQADQIEIRWPSGTQQILKSVKANQTLTAVEPPR